MAGHDRMDAAMFWTGALFVFTPILAALGVIGVILYHRRRQARQGGQAGGPDRP
jgi:hypothetical protein